MTAKRAAAPARRRLLQAAAAGALLYGLPAGAQQPRARPNLEYFDIAPQPVPPGPRIEVIEFFWYGCPYCYQLEPFLDGWLKRKPEDVDFRYVPAVFRQSWMPHARLFYVLESLGELGRLHTRVYEAIHVERKYRPLPLPLPGAVFLPPNLAEVLASADTAAIWAVDQGIDRDRFITAYNAPAMDKKVEQSIADTRRYQIKGTPSVVVDGRYVTSTGMSESVSGVIGILDDLVRLARERRAKA